MRPQISLKLFVILTFLVLALVLVTGYSFLSFHFFRKGVDSITAVHMEETARSYVQSVPPSQRGALDSYYGYHIAQKWQQLPEELQNAFSSPPTRRQRYIVHRERSKNSKRHDAMYFIFLYEENTNQLYIGRKTSYPSRHSLLSQHAAQSRKILILISLALAGILALSIVFMYRRISKPVRALEEWTSSLGPEKFDEPLPDFSYPELNRMAELVHNSLSSVQDSLDREHRFLRYASHELRTPIAIIRNNIELFSKIEHLPEPRRGEEQEQLFGRIDRASMNMQYLTETLLWLYRDDSEDLPEKQLELDKYVRKVVEEMRYLLIRKEVELQIETHPSIVFVPEIPAQIVLINLIRNAFQHTLEGCITICQQDNVVTISNPQPYSSDDDNTLGFGFGLQLIGQLTQKLGWKYEAQSEQSLYTASITLNPDE